MPSQARAAFGQNVLDIEQLLLIHRYLGGDAKGRRYGLEVLNKSAIVLITAMWEAYCEDLAAEALDHLAAYASSASQLPKELKKRIAKDIDAVSDELAMWKLADTGWRTLATARLTSLMEERNRRLNTPKADQIDDLFATAVGLSDVSSAWRWKRMSVAQARSKLDKYVTLRGEIAHRGVAATGVKKVQVTDYLRHVRRLVAKTGGRVNTHVRNAIGKALW